MSPASSSSPKKARASASPSKFKTKSPGIRKRQSEWNASLPPPWVKQPNFRHPEGTWTIYSKAKAMKEYKLNDREIATLPYEQRLNKDGAFMHVYSQSQVLGLALKKCAKLEVEFEVNGVIYHSYTGSSETGWVSAVSFRNPPQLPTWKEHILNPQPPPLKIAEYTSPSHPNKPDPPSITWTPSRLLGPVLVADACRLYCIEPKNIQDLSAHSRWIDLATVAKRAVSLHGGFYAHEELVRQRRIAEEDKLTRENPHRADEWKSRFEFSPMIQKQWESSRNDWMHRTASTPKYRVAVFYPIESEDMGDYGCQWEWTPSWGEF